ncbi:ABC transporter permease [Sediminispirochaeta bajacaliforniensis]|uniref:ABC transporter permease n=1 Tax=Sediminispirochaeta bajacaliforniensis TaxID=148 RepID=UPI0003735610|nr:ABC transporter permease [Sediminispirochaeta bajacaliforniensis]
MLGVRKKQASKKAGHRELGVFFALLLLILFFSITSPFFFKLNNLINIVRQISLLGIIAMGMTMVIVSGEIDLSVGAIYGAAAIVSGMVLTHGGTVFLAVVAALATGIFFGALNGVLTTYGRIPALIVTLGMMNIARGAALVLCNARVISLSKRTVESSGLGAFLFLGQGKVFHIPVVSIIFIAVVIIANFLYSKTLLGFRLRAVGGNKLAAKAAGLNQNLIKIAAFGITGLLCALAGILNLSFLANVQGTTGTGLEMDVISAVIIGGTSLSGGEGTIIGTLIGVLIMGVLKNGIILLGVSPFFQMLIIGIVIIVAVGIDMWSRKAQ